jgi:2',3'-cyclic-nucleotide 2'-phosphodiesterase (5'-nucleotidase family)
VAVGGLRIAVLGVLPTNALDWTGAFQKPEAVKIEEPGKAIRAVLPAVMREKPDAVILLSQLDYEPTAALASALPEITVAVSCGMKAGCSDDPASPVFHTADGKALPATDGVIHLDDIAGSGSAGGSAARVLYVGSKGKDLGIISMSFKHDGTVAFGRETLKRLDDAVPEEPAVRDIVNQVFYRKPAANKTSHVDPKSHKELMEGLQQSPEAFMEQYRKNHKDAVVFPPEIFQQKSASGQTAGKAEEPEKGGLE